MPPPENGEKPLDSVGHALTGFANSPCYLGVGQSERPQLRPEAPTPHLTPETRPPGLDSLTTLNLGEPLPPATLVCHGLVRLALRHGPCRWDTTTIRVWSLANTLGHHESRVAATHLSTGHPIGVEPGKRSDVSGRMELRSV